MKTVSQGSPGEPGMKGAQGTPGERGVKGDGGLKGDMGTPGYDFLLILFRKT